MSRTYNTEAVQGERWTRRVRYEEDDGTPIPITGFDVAMQIRTHDKGPLIAEANITRQDAEGIIDLEVTSEDTLAMDARQYYYDLFVNQVPWMLGAFEVKQGMTKPEVV